MKLTLGQKDGEPVQIDVSATGGLRLIGRGAAGAERALLLQAVRDAKEGARQVLTVGADLCRLLGEDGGRCLTDAGLPGVHVAATVADALDHLGAEIVGRSASVEGAEVDEHWAARAVPLLCVLGPESHASRLDPELRLGADLAIGGLVLGEWQQGTTVAIDSSGVVVDATGQAAEGLIGARVPLVSEADALEQALIITDRRAAKPVGAGGAETQPLPGFQSDTVTVPPGIVRLFGSFAVEGTTKQVGRAMDVWALLGLLAEHRNGLLTREMAEAKIWPGIDPGPDRFPTLLRDARRKLSYALGWKSNTGKDVIQKVGNGYRLNPDLFTCDIWQLRDLLTAAATSSGTQKTATLRAVVDLFTEPYLPGLQHDWAGTAARAVNRSVVDALTQLAALEAVPQRAVLHLERATGLDPTAEPLYRDRMKIYAELGRAVAIQHCYDELSEGLKGAGRKPDAQTLRLYRDLVEGA